MKTKKNLKILITGFRPFNNENDNASERIANSFRKYKSENFSIVVLITPVVWESAKRMLLRAIKKEKPNIIISLGRSVTANTFKLEPVLINCSSDRDEVEKFPKNPYIIKGGPEKYNIDLPFKKISQFLKENGVSTGINKYPAESMTYLCGYVAYLSRYFANEYCDKKTITIFIHVPILEKMSLETAKKGVELIVKFLTDLKLKNKKLK